MKILNTKFLLGEGVVSLYQRELIIAFDILGKKACIISPNYNWQYEIIELPFMASCAMEAKDGDIIIAANHHLYKTNDFKDFKPLLKHDLPDDVRMNDGKEDPLGNFWYSSMHMDSAIGLGQIYRYDPERNKSKIMFDNLSIPNSICFDERDKIGYYTDSKEGIIKKFDYTKNKPLSVDHINLQFNTFVPDGSFIDKNGHLWNAQWGNGKVVKYNKCGNIIGNYSFPTSNITCPLIYKDHLIVTSAQEGLTETQIANEPEAGNIFIIGLK